MSAAPEAPRPLLSINLPEGIPYHQDRTIQEIQFSLETVYEGEPRAFQILQTTYVFDDGEKQASGEFVVNGNFVDYRHEDVPAGSVIAKVLAVMNAHFMDNPADIDLIQLEIPHPISWVNLSEPISVSDGNLTGIRFDVDRDDIMAKVLKTTFFFDDESTRELYDLGVKEDGSIGFIQGASACSPEEAIEAAIDEHFEVRHSNFENLKGALENPPPVPEM